MGADIVLQHPLPGRVHPPQQEPGARVSSGRERLQLDARGREVAALMGADRVVVVGRRLTGSAQKQHHRRQRQPARARRCVANPHGGLPPSSW